MAQIDLSKITDEDVARFNDERTAALLKHEGTWVHDIPFFLVPVDIVMGFRGNCFTAQEFYLSEVWKESAHWNAGLVKDGKIVIFMYGHINTLSKYLYVERIGACRSVQSYGLGVWELSIKEGERIAREKGCKYIWTTTFRMGEIRKFLKSTDGVVLNPPTMQILRKDLKNE